MESKRALSDYPTHHQSKKIQIETPADDEMPKLPEEIVIEILTRLPVKSLLKFKCVCKAWLSLISSSQFIKTHLKNSTSDAIFSNYRIMLTFSHPFFNLKQCSIHSLLYDSLTVVYDIDYPMKNLHSDLLVVGSCNGLICIAIDEMELLLWNPSTRISKRLPPLAVEMNKGFFGFGYNASDDDYKVVAIFRVLGNASIYESIVKIYSLKTNSWKRIEDFKRGIPLNDSSKLASGRLHFSAMMDGWQIISFDLDTEVYGTVEQPNYREGYIHSSFGVLRECICVLYNYDTTGADLWVLEEYGIKESWDKVACIPYIDGPGAFFHSYPLCMLPNGDILLVFGMYFVVYNPKDNCFRHLYLGSFLEANMYLESLVSIPMED